MLTGLPVGGSSSAARAEPRGRSAITARSSISGDERAHLDAALAGARRGDEYAFGVLWRELNPRVLRYLRSCGESSVEDIAAETWAQAVAGFARFRGDADRFRAWLFTIARNRAIDAGRKASSVPTCPFELHEARAVESAESVVVERLSTEQAVQLVRELPADQAEAVALRYIADLDVATVARVLGKSPAAVRVNAHRGLRSLASRVAAQPSRAVS